MIRSSCWLTAILAIGPAASPYRSGCVNIAVAKEGKPRRHAQVEYELRKGDPAWFSKVIIAAGAGVSAAPARSALTAPAPPICVQPLLTDLSAELEPLRSDFNRNASSTRLLLILSPS